MQDILFVIDMQNDFITGSLGSQQAIQIVPKVQEKIQHFSGTVFFTRDTHFENYLTSQEGKKLPISHCIKDTEGWQIAKEIDQYRVTTPIDKLTFGSSELGSMLIELNQQEPISSIAFIGLCTDICVISNVMIAKAFLPECEIIVDAACCAGVSEASHRNALQAMKACQVTIIHE